MLLFQTPPDAPRWKRWFVYSPLARIVIFVVLSIVLSAIPLLLLKAAGISMKDLSPADKQLLGSAAQNFAAIVAYFILVRFIERRRFTELPAGKALPHLGLGIVYGALLMTGVVAALWAVGSFRVDGFNPGASWVFPLLVAGVGAGVSEELIFRGVLFRISEEGLGTWWALAISGLFFGGVHIANANATVWSSVAIAIEAGLLIGLLYHVTRSLWLCMGLHGGWNFFQGYVYGVPVSGHNEPGFMVSSRPGPEWLTGGAFGVEASVVCVLLNVGVALALLQVARRRKSLVPARRKRAPMMEAAPASA